MSLGMNDVPAGNSDIAVPASLNVQPVAGTTSGASSRCTRCVSVADVPIGRGGGIRNRYDARAFTMYSYAGPVMAEPSGFLATGSEIVVASRVPGSTDASHPLQTSV